MDHEAARLEKRHVHDVYQSTAPYFSDLQSKAWPRVRQFLQEQKPGSLIADIVIHHFSTKQRRIQAIKEMARVLVPGGQLMIYVWAMEQKNRHFEKQDVLVPWNRALCSRLLSACSQPGRRPPCGHPDRGHPCGPPCSVCSCSVCFKERRDSKRSHSLDCEPARARTCCANVSKEGGEENGFCNTLGKSFRSWFCSRSLDESALGKQMERVRPVKNTEGWATSTVSIQPSRHSSLDIEPQEPFSPREQNLNEDVFVETSPKHLEWLRAPAAAKHLNGDHQGEIGSNGDGNPLDSTDTNEKCVPSGNLEEGNPSASKILRRISAVDPTDSIPDDTMSVEGQEPDVLDPRAFMRYYHVFREGELCGLVRENVSELHILSSGNDHGNWCIVAEKESSG
ncbi:PREDICTED: probable tRNA methyltransferase 9-like protein isoform X2 [Miniopterus natalensis]|uniref:probable tRNA methyltransferase 9-like protein isoform X2 n=1 Tax=Miniopterus natalensis TaxID=291302 RepID=UPI0007A71AFE|nr:PREDICTED: probable tRNA methyltransferase 9-like protein isoform X2 [Miniopterus natalensis]